MENSGRTDSNFSFIQRSETWLSVTFLVTLIVLIIPLPTFLLDMLLACNLAAAIILLLVTLGAKKPLDVSVFPSVLLLLTLFRLSLNVSTTRLILLNADAGKIVLTFGDFVVGGNLIVGIVIFLILITIQFIVITKGATRISEVNARFTLDAMPGKQMAIDAELNSGAISEVEARDKRANIMREAEFYGAMDGASKYVRGDAIAGLIIMVVNIVGGVLLGVTEGQAVGDALQIYAILTIGDGLVSQIPALIIATSAGMLVTKSASKSTLGDEISLQVTRGYKSLSVGAFIMLVVSLTPGFPKIPFIVIGIALIWFVRFARSVETKREEEEKKQQSENDQVNQQAVSPEEKSLEQFLQTDRIVVEIGAGLIPLVDPSNGQGLGDRIATMRQDMAKQYGFWIPQVRLRDNLEIDVYSYRVYVSGREVGSGSLKIDEKLAINPGNVSTKIDGEPTIDPAFGLPAVWISEGNARRAQMIGYTVVDAATVLITHLGESLRNHAHELLSREDMQKMLDKLKEIAPTIVEDIRSDTVRPSVLHQVLLRLLAENIPITSLERIVEAAVQAGPTHKTVSALVEKVRESLGHLICNSFRNENGMVRVIVFEPKLEYQFRQSNNNGAIVLPPATLERLVVAMQEHWEAEQIKNKPACFLVDSSIRLALRQTTVRSLRKVSILAYSEIPEGMLIDPVSVIQHDQVIDPNDNVKEFSILPTETGGSDTDSNEDRILN